MQDRTPSHRKDLFTLLFTVFLDFLGLGIIIPIIAPVFLDPAKGALPVEYSFASRTFILGLLMATFPVAQFFGAPILGALSDKYGRKRILLISIFGSAISLLLFGIGISTRKVIVIFCSRILAGFAGGNVATAQSAIADLSDMQSKARNFGLMGTMFGLGFILGPFLGGKLADSNMVSWFNYATPFWVAAFLSGINLILISTWLNETLKTPKTDASVSFTTGFRNLRKAFSSSHLRIIFSVVFFTVFGFSFFAQFFQVYLIQKFQFNQAHIGMTFAYIGVWIALTQGGITRVLSKHVTPYRTLKFSLLLMSSAFLVLLIPQEAGWLYVALPLVSIFQGITTPNATALISNAASYTEQGEILGINQSVQSAALAIPPIVAGLVTSLDVQLPIILASAATFIAWLIYIILYKNPIQVKATT
jgi:MFS transporter, DHA1 family, tetracycline resistance protein